MGSGGSTGKPIRCTLGFVWGFPLINLFMWQKWFLPVASPARWPCLCPAPAKHSSVILPKVWTPEGREGISKVRPSEYLVLSPVQVGLRCFYSADRRWAS